jgi:predicted dehydrogenase
LNALFISADDFNHWLFGWRQHRHFLAMLRGEEVPDSSAHDGLAAILVAEAIYRSAASGDWQPVVSVEPGT